MIVCVGKFDIQVSAPKLGIELLVSEHATTTLKGKQVGGGRAWVRAVGVGVICAWRHCVLGVCRSARTFPLWPD